MLINLDKIKFDSNIQSRESLNNDIITEYAEQMKNGVSFPPVIVFYDGEVYWLADGFHRITAAIVAGISEFECDVQMGNKRDAILYSVGANASHGLRRTNADKRKAVMMLLQDEEWSKWSNNEIAKRCAVSHTFVNELRKSLESVSSEKIYINKHGQTSTMDTTNIGKTPFKQFIDNNKDKVRELAEENTVRNDSGEIVITKDDDWCQENEWDQVSKDTELDNKTITVVDDIPTYEPEIVEGATPFDVNTKQIISDIAHLTLICEPEEIVKLRPHDVVKIKMDLEVLKERIINVINFINNYEMRR